MTKWLKINAEKTQIATKVCPFCGDYTTLEVESEDLDKYNRHVVHVQEAFPYIEDAERERLITGICPKCWDENFKDDDTVADEGN